MGCVVCNWASLSVIKCDGEFTVRELPADEDHSEFLNELAYDIARHHPEIVENINKYVRKSKLCRRCYRHDGCYLDPLTSEGKNCPFFRKSEDATTL